MRLYFPLIFSVVLILIFGTLEILLLRFLNRDWWQRRWIRRAAWGLPLFGIVGVVVWGIGEYIASDWLAYPGGVLAALAFVLEFALMLSLPVSGLLHLVGRLIDRVATSKEDRNESLADPNRRMILRTAAAVVPMAALGSGFAGLNGAMSEVRINTVPLFYSKLPKDLEGFKILHLTDLHMRRHAALDDLAELLDRAKKLSPDLILVTGDIADHLPLLSEALSLVSQLSAPFGAYACLGNHEYFRGIRKVIRDFEKSPVPLFINSGLTIKIGSASLFIGGLDDPRRMGAKQHDFFVRTIKATMAQESGSDFTLLMSHRPDALDYAGEVGIDLVLAGHTHGGQIGLNGKSLFEDVWPDRYLWGRYQRGDTQLYTSAGVGHWFPFRLGCPPEAPLIILGNA